jgi:ankyrin repeat protein
MPNQSESLINAILADDRARVKQLLKAAPELAIEPVKKARLALELPHWIYVGDTPLHVAAAGYRVEIATLLLAAGADVNAAGRHRHARPLHYAADGNPERDAKRQVAMIRLLLEAGADIHAQDKNGATPLHRAVRTRCAEAVNCLLDAGADATMRNKPGSTAFHLAVQNTGRGGSGADRAKAAQREIIRAFRERGVSTSLKDARGKSVLEWARSDEIREMLTTNGDKL